MEKNNKAAVTKAAKFTKEQILGSAEFASRRDALNAILVDGKDYSKSEVVTMLDNFMKGKVK